MQLCFTCKRTITRGFVVKRRRYWWIRKLFLCVRPKVIAGTLTVLHTQDPYNQLPLSYYRTTDLYNMWRQQSKLPQPLVLAARVAGRIRDCGGGNHSQAVQLKLYFWWRHSTDLFSTYKRKGWTTSVPTLSRLPFSVTYREHWSSWCSPGWTSPSSGREWPSWQSPGQPGSYRSTGLCINSK